MIRFFDIVLSSIGLLIAAPLMSALWVICWCESRSPLFRQVRVGRNQKHFVLIKFRTMRIDTESVPTHMISPSSVTFFGAFMRRAKLDELPQLWNVLRGDMSLVGPRPGLPSQAELTAARARVGVFEARPGLTGLGQLSGIDMSTPEVLAEVDALMLKDLNWVSYLRFVALTACGAGKGDRVRR